MAICKKCGSKIDYLRFSARVETFGNFDGGNWNTEDWGDWHNLELACPDCDNTLFTDEDKAEDFLNDKDELKELVNEKLNKRKMKNENKNRTRKKTNKRI